MEAGMNRKRYGTEEPRLQSRPPSESRTLRGNTNAFDLLSQPTALRPKSTYGRSYPNNKARPQAFHSESDHDSVGSDDQLDALSEASPQKFVDRYGKKHDYHPDYKPGKEKPYKNLKFKKTKSSDATERTRAPSVMDLSSQENTPAPRKPTGFSASTEKTPKCPHSSTHERDINYDAIPDKPKSIKPKPRPRHAQASKYTPPTPKTKVPDLPRRRKNRPASRPASRCSSVDISDDPPRAPITVVQPFPMDLPPRSSLPSSSTTDPDSPPQVLPRPFPCPSPTRSSPPSPPPRRVAEKPRKVKPFPMNMSPLRRAKSSTELSPTKSPPAKRNAKKPRKIEPFPMTMSPPSRPAKSTNTIKGKGRRSMAVVSSSEGSDEEDEAKVAVEKDRVKAKAAPFPLGTQFFGSPVAGPSKARNKRHSSGFDSDASPRKKSKAGDSLLDDSYAFEEESFFISASTDPKTLCPYCDNPLPPSPSPTLVRLLETMVTKSTRDPRPANPLGRKAPFATFIGLCQRHRFETDILPEADRKGWPKAIDWKRLSGRIEDMKSDLQLLISDSSDDGPRSKSVFWLEIMEAVKAKGSRAATGVKDQFLNFEKTQPGYYGELGSVIIHQTLYNMFPPVSIDVSAISPLAAEEFIQRVLIPEVALQLIMDDKSLRGDSGRKTALRILRESSAYGVAMFPADSSESGVKAKKHKEGLNAGETIVMERARKRRKEIEEEEAREEAAAEAEWEAARPRPRPRPIAKGSSKPSMMDVSKSDDDENDNRNGKSHDMDFMEQDLNGIDKGIDYRADDSDADSEILVSSQLAPPPRRVGSSPSDRSRSKSATSSVTKPDGQRTSSKKGKGRAIADTSASEAETPRSSKSSSQSNRGPRVDSVDAESSASLSIVEIDEPPMMKTPKPTKTFRQPPARVAEVHDQSTPRAPLKSSQEMKDLPPLERARRMREATARALAPPPLVPPVPRKQAAKIRGALLSSSPGSLGSMWQHSMQADFVTDDDKWLLDDVHYSQH